MKREALFYIAGVFTALGITTFAAQLDVNPNAFPIVLNGEPIEMEAYNLNGSTYFKLRDIGEKIGFGVDFIDNTIVLTTGDRTVFAENDTAKHSYLEPALPQQLPDGAGATAEETLAELKQRLAEKVASGDITQAEADEILSRFGE